MELSEMQALITRDVLKVGTHVILHLHGPITVQGTVATVVRGAEGLTGVDLDVLVQTTDLVPGTMEMRTEVVDEQRSTLFVARSSIVAVEWVTTPEDA